MRPVAALEAENARLRRELASAKLDLAIDRGRSALGNRPPFEIYRHLSAAAPFVNDVTVPFCGSKRPQEVPASNAIAHCQTATIYQLFYRHDTALKASVFRKPSKMVAIKCLTVIGCRTRQFRSISLPSSHCE
jgi:hypothetical protein